MCRTVMLPPATLSVAMFMTWMGYRWAQQLTQLRVRASCPVWTLSR